MRDDQDRWRVRTSDGETAGPFDAEALGRMLAVGTIGPDDLVRSESTGRVRRVRDVAVEVIEESRTADDEVERPREAEAEIGGMDRLLPTVGREWIWLFVPTFGLPVGFLVALGYWLLGWMGAAHCETERGRLAAEAIIDTSRRWMLAWAVLGALIVVLAVVVPGLALIRAAETLIRIPPIW